MPELLDHPLALALGIFFARVADVSLGTVRTILVMRGFRWQAGLTGFLEVLIWTFAAGAALQNLENWYAVLGYAGGFGTGNIAGIWLEERLAIGRVMVRAISSNPEIGLAAGLAQDHEDVVVLDAFSGNDDPAEVVFIVVKRRLLQALIRRVEELDPDAIWSVSDVKQHRAVNRQALPVPEMAGLPGTVSARR